MEWFQFQLCLGYGLSGERLQASRSLWFSCYLYYSDLLQSLFSDLLLILIKELKYQNHARQTIIGVATDLLFLLEISTFSGYIVFFKKGLKDLCMYSPVYFYEHRRYIYSFF